MPFVVKTFVVKGSNYFKKAECRYLCNFIVYSVQNKVLMEESKRQKQVARLIEETMNAIFQKEGLTMAQGGMVSISKVQVTPDLLEARVYLSFFKIEQPEALLKSITDKTGELRGYLGNKLRHQLRRIPELHFFQDDTLDYVFKMEEIFKQIKSSGDNKNP